MWHSWGTDANAFITQWSNWIAIGCLLFAAVVLRLKNKLPSAEGFAAFVNVLGTQAGNILILAVFSLFFFQVGMRFMYFALHMVADKRLTENNSVMMLGIQWVTGAAFGGAFGAMLKTMSPRDLHKDDSPTGNSSDANQASVANVPKVAITDSKTKRK